jgi:carbonic anhydrase
MRISLRRHAMDRFKELFEYNRLWAENRKAEDAHFFERLCEIQSPEFLWIGCADSRVPANQITGLQPGEVFVHRNIANVVPPNDLNSASVIQYAVDALRIEHIIVCGHYGCGGVRAALDGELEDPLDSWIDLLRDVRDMHSDELAALADENARWARLCELNVMQQVRNVAALPIVRHAWQRNQPLAIHGWIYDLQDGLLKDLGVEITGPN